MWTPENEAKYKAALARFYHGSKIAGAGILVSDRYVLTCAHVLTRANTPPAEVGLDFPFQGDGQQLKGTVEYWEPERDIAGVRLLDPLPPGTKPLPFRPSRNYTDGNFKVYGFPDKQPIGGWALGRIIGDATGNLVQIQGDTDQGYGIEPGFSGAPVWSVEFGGVIGLARLRDKDRPDAKIAYLIPYRQLIDALKGGEAISLLALLEGAAVPSESVEGAYRVCRPEGALQPVPEDLPSKVKALARMKDQGGYSALVRFAVCLTLAEFPVALPLKQQLRAWLKQREIDTEAVEQAIAPQIQLEQAITANTASPHLLIWLKTSDIKGVYSIGSLFIPDRTRYNWKKSEGFEPIPAIAPYEDTPIQLAQLPEVIQACLADCRGLCSSAELANLTIELFLPFSLLKESLEWAAAFAIGDEDDDDLEFLEDEDEPDPLAILHRFVVRCSDRLLNAYERKGFRALWEQQWIQIDPNKQSPCCTALLPAEDDTNLKELKIELLQNPEKVGIQLLKCPTQLAVGNPLKAVLTSGAPTAIWLRESLSQVDCNTEFTTLLGCCVEGLPESVRQARRNAFPLAKDEHIGHHLSLVWEDPNLVPPDTDDLAS
ncbi:VMAP-C domain-containing protein [Leptolyngbya iicbica]|uniref:Serine protease n=2 Tax=Cyanophyceae TaxID=3028117 RepID=A0A4V2E2S2_9CYAN|nr:trypsin-like peptidase domain-containing protein [Leptolyngbya sp. LK]RZM79546.1 serine protease [Leptolyngbya sp. LK]